MGSAKRSMEERIGPSVGVVLLLSFGMANIHLFVVFRNYQGKKSDPNSFRIASVKKKSP